MTVRIMADLETMSAQRDAAIISIGAVVFMNGMPIDNSPSFYDRIAPEFATAFGHVDKATMEWWDKQDPKVRAEAFGGTSQPGRVLERFDKWIEEICRLESCNIADIELWSRGADFDLAILTHAYEQIQGSYPFNFRKHMCERTVRNLVPKELLAIADAERKPGTAHNALEDAKNQAHYMNHALAWLKVQ